MRISRRNVALNASSIIRLLMSTADCGVAVCFSGASITSMMSRALHSWNSGNTAGFAA
ncbi:hypothetical protein FQZ97_940420 [compost metagenome]